MSMSMDEYEKWSVRSKQEAYAMKQNQIKMLLLNPGGVCVIGHWADWAVAWAPLPKLPDHIKDKLCGKQIKST